MPAFPADALIAALPFARRYARALVGSQVGGDRLVARALAEPPTRLTDRLALYAGITRLAPLANEPGRLGRLERSVLLLTSLEAMSLAEAAAVVGRPEAETVVALTDARAVLRAAAAADVLIIEDEPLAALDLCQVVERSGHRVAGIAATEAAALRLAAETAAALLLAEVNLARAGDGLVALRRLLEGAPVPVIVITAYPEALLTADGVEPAFVLPKPLDAVTLAVATYQARMARRPPLD